MSTPTALMPEKHVRFADSTLAVAGWARQQLGRPRTLDELLTHAHREANRGSHGWLKRVRFEDLVYASTLLFALGDIERGAEDRLVRRGL